MSGATLAQLIQADAVAAVQTAIVATLKAGLSGVAVTAHPGKVDLSELVAKSVVSAPGIGIGWSRVRPEPLMDGSWSAVVDWTAYVVAEAAVVDSRRVEKETVGLAIGQHLLRLLSHDITSLWGRTGILPAEKVELKPFFTVRDASQGTAYYVVTWCQVVADIGETVFPAATGTIPSADEPVIAYERSGDIDELARYWPARKDDGDA